MQEWVFKFDLGSLKDFNKGFVPKWLTKSSHTLPAVVPKYESEGEGESEGMINKNCVGNKTNESQVELVELVVVNFNSLANSLKKAMIEDAKYFLTSEAVFKK